MPIDSQYDPDRSTFTIRVIGRFDYGEHQYFSKAMMLITPGMNKIVIDLKETTHMDSSALGMLLVLLETVKKNQPLIKIINAKDQVWQTLENANFYRLFTIESFE